MKWGDPRDFFAERCADTEDEREWMSGDTLYAHYRRRCFRCGVRALGLGRFRAALERRTEGVVEEVHGHIIYPLEILDEEHWELAEGPPTTQEPTRARASLRVLVTQAYRDVPMPAGEVVRWLEPTWGEKQRLEPDDLVVEWRGARRYIKSRAAEVVDS